MAPRKVDFALAFREQITKLADVAEELHELNLVYFASGYNSGGAAPSEDADLTGHDLTVAQVANMSTVSTALDALLSNGSPAQGDYWTLINAVRNV